MYKIEITTDTADSLFRDILIQDYKNLSQEIRCLEDRLQDLKPFEFEDLCNNRRYRDAIQIAFEYYLTVDERKNVVDENSDSK